MSSEVSPLLKRISRFNSHWLLNLSKHLCLSSKAAILIILWATVVGTAYTFIQDIVAISILGSRYALIEDVAILDLIPYVTLTLIMIFYPLSGFIADVHCGRFRTAMFSLILMLFSFMLLGTACTIAFYSVESNTRPTLNHGLRTLYKQTVAFYSPLSLPCSSLAWLDFRQTIFN